MVSAWLVFFGDGERFSWWDIWTRPGFRHVLAAGFDVAADRWVIFDPKAKGTEITVLPPGPEVERRLAELSRCRALRVVPRPRRRLQPIAGGCVGAIAALVGAPGALSPRALYRHLLAQGAELAWWPEPPAPYQDVQ